MTAMRTTIDLDDDLVKEAMDLLGVKTKRAAIQRSLQEVIRRERRNRLKDRFGSLDLQLTLNDLEKMREDES